MTMCIFTVVRINGTGELEILGTGKYPSHQQVQTKLMDYVMECYEGTFLNPKEKPEIEEIDQDINKVMVKCTDDSTIFGYCTVADQL